MAKFKFDTSPLPYMLLGESHLSWDVASAIAELIDNSLGEGRGNAKNVVIAHDKKKRILHIIDDGEGFVELDRLLRLGHGAGRKAGDIGLYGMGGSKALMWLGSKVIIQSLHGNQVAEVKVTWDEVQKGDKFEPVEGRIEKASQANVWDYLWQFGHGTYIMIFLKDERLINDQAIMSKLGKIYALAKGAGRKIQWMNTKFGKFKDPIDIGYDIVSKFTEKVDIDFTIDHDGKKLPVKGKIGVVPDHPINDCKVHFGFSTRIIFSTKDCFSAGDKSFTGRDMTGLIRLAGDDWTSKLTTTKEGLDDKPLQDKLMQAIFNRIEKLLTKMEDKALQVVFDDLATSMSIAMDDVHRTIKAKVDKTIVLAEVRAARERGTGPGPGPGPGGEKVDTKIHPQKEDGEDGNVGARSLIEIHPRNDSQMANQLCSVEHQKTKKKMVAFINKDHPLIKEALISKPINTKLLHTLIVHQVARMFFDEPDLAKEAFGKSVAEAILNDPDADENVRENKLVRLIIDRVVA